MFNVDKETLDEMLAQCTTEALNEWMSNCTTEEIAVLVCVMQVWRKCCAEC